MTQSATAQQGSDGSSTEIVSSVIDGEVAEPGVLPVSERVAVTHDAADLLVKLRMDHGPLMFHQSGGCCDGSSPMCYPDGDFITGDSDVHLGDLKIPAGPGSDPFTVPVFMSKPQFEYWRHTHLTIDVVPGRGAGFSLEAPLGVRFMIRSRLLTQTELTELGEL